MADNAGQSSSKSRTAMGVGAVLLLEAVVIVGAMMWFLGPSDVQADPEQVGHAPAAEEDRVREIQVLDRRLPNNKTGVTYLYDTEIYVQVRQRHAERVERELEQFRNEITAEINAIWRTSQPSHFREPNHENLNRKVDALLQERFGNDARTGDPIILRSIIVMGTGFRIDS